MKLSVIICVYNTDKEYFEKCLESIASSTLCEIEGEYEICIVDDGSDADYSEIAKKYGAILIKTENQGIYAARETGFKMSKGEYISFCDSDDTVSYSYHLPMLIEAETTGADIIIGDWATHTSRARYYFENDEIISRELDLSGDEKLYYFFKHGGKYHSFYVLWNKLYRREILSDSFQGLSDLKYPKITSYSEDVAINFFAFRNAKRIKNIHTGFYFYRIHPTQSVNAISKEKILSQVECMQKTFDIMSGNLEENLYGEKISELICEWKVLMARWHESLAKSNGHAEILPIIRKIYGVRESDFLISSGKTENPKYRLLAQNFEEIDKALFSIWKSHNIPSIKFDKSDIYTKRCAEELIKSKKAKLAKGAPDVVIPKAKKPTRLRLLLNPFLYTLGLRLFKKSSKARAFLKKFI